VVNCFQTVVAEVAINST